MQSHEKKDNFILKVFKSLSVSSPDDKAKLNDHNVDVSLLSRDELGHYFSVACFENQTERALQCILELKKMGINHNLKKITLENEAIQGPPLFVAAYFGNEKIISALLDQGAEVNSSGEIFSGDEKIQRISTISIAINRLHVEAVSLLLDTGASSSHVYYSEHSAAEWSIFHDIAASYDFVIRDAGKKREQLMKLFQEYKISPDESIDENSLLIKSSAHGDVDTVVSYLRYVDKVIAQGNLAYFGSEFKENKEDLFHQIKTLALRSAVDHKQPEIVKILRKQRAGIDEVCKMDSTFFDAVKNNRQVMECLFPVEVGTLDRIIKLSRRILDSLSVDVSLKSGEAFFEKKSVGSAVKKLFEVDPATVKDVYKNQLKGVLQKAHEIMMADLLIEFSKEQKRGVGKSKLSQLDREFKVYLEDYLEMLRLMRDEDGVKKLDELVGEFYQRGDKKPKA